MDLKLGEKYYCWQRVIIKSQGNRNDGKIIWVFNLPPIEDSSYFDDRGFGLPTGPMYFTNIVDNEGYLFGIKQEAVEFISGDDPELNFAEDVNIVHIDQVDSYNWPRIKEN